MFFELNDITKRFGPDTVLDRVSFAAQEGEIVSLVGPSGVGKTTLLSIIAGLETPDSGEVRFARPPSRKNPIILVFQDYILFPNMTVFDNVAFGLKSRGLKRGDIRNTVMDMLTWFGLADKRTNYPAELSAGQKQRTAIARAMVVEPSILLLDEPFANLDRNLKLETARFIRDTQKNFGITTVAVTHDLEEAFSMSDKMGIMLGGKLVEFDTVDRVYRHPATLEAAEFLGPVNRIPARILERIGSAGAAGGLIRQNGSLFARPEALTLLPDPAGSGRVRDKHFAGHYVVYTVELEGESFTVYSPSDGFAPGQSVRLALTEETLHQN